MRQDSHLGTADTGGGTRHSSRARLKSPWFKASIGVFMAATVGIGFFTDVLSLTDRFGITAPSPQTERVRPVTDGTDAGSADVLCSSSPDDSLPVGWGPDRPIYYDDTFPETLTFNSTIMNSNIGDERNWVGARPDSASGGDTWSSTLEVSSGESYTIRAYVRLDGPDRYAAEDTRLSIYLPTCSGLRVGVSGLLSARNVFPTEVWDGLEFRGEEEFNLLYVPNSLRLANNAGEHMISESIFTSDGALLGYEVMDGKFPPGYQSAGYLTFRVIVQGMST